MKRIISVIMVVSLLLTGFVYVNRVYAVVFELERLEQLSKKQAPAIDLFNRICECYSIDEYALSFPAEYGGAYLTKDNRLVIKVLQGSSVLKNDILSRFSDADLCIEETDITLQELFDMALALRDEMIYPNGIKASVEIDQMNSEVIIGIDQEERDSEKLESIYKYKACEHIRIRECHIEITGNIYGGDSLYRKNGAIYPVLGTLGYCGIYNGIPSILTAGHMAQYYDLYFGPSNLVNLSSNTACRIQFANGQPGDYAIIPLSDYTTNTITSKIRTSVAGNYLTINGASYSTDHNTLYGVLVIKYGYATGITSATIKNTGVTSSVTNGFGVSKNITQLIAVNNDASSVAFCSFGDSGGPVYRVLSNGSRYAMGIVSASDSLNATTGYYTPMALPFDQGFFIY